MENEILLQAKGICKCFGPTKALVGVDIEVRGGEIRGLIGENGSGKSTLASIFAGIQAADRGEMFLAGRPYRPSSMIDAQSSGISMVVQEMGTISGITVAENIFVGKENRFTKFAVVNKKKMNAEAARKLAEIGAGHIDPQCPVDMLDLEDRKLVEIARALYDEPDLFIVDETTTALSHKGREIIYRLMDKLKKENRAVLFISHDLDELISVCNVLTVLRDGVLIENLPRLQMEPQKIKSLMVGRELNESYYREDYDGNFSDEVVLKVERLTSGVLEDFSFELHKGEILGIGGLSGSGMHELGRCIFGIDKAITGRVTLFPKKVMINNTWTAISNNVGYVSKNRDQEALFLQANILENLVMPALDMLKKGVFIFQKSEKRFAMEQVEALRIKCSSLDQEVRFLSGGNKQKVSFGKWIGNKSEILVLDCPTRGIDIGVKASMYSLMYELKKQGKSIIMISEELPELIGMSDRIMILKNGKLVETFNRSRDLSEQQIIEVMI